jgi:hypothetical protein
MKTTISATIGHATDAIYMTVNVDIEITSSDTTESHGFEVDTNNGSIDIDKINYCELVTFDVGVDVTAQIKKKYKEEPQYRYELEAAIKDFINDNELRDIETY